MYKPTILETTSEYEKDTKTAQWEGWRTTWDTRCGALKAVCHNIHQALDKEYHDQLEDDLMGYK